MTNSNPPSGSPSPSSDIDHILSFGYDDPAFINDVHALIGPNKVPEAKAAIESLIAAERQRLLDVFEGIIGEDEPFDFKNGSAIPMMVEEAWKNGRNDLRKEQRTRLQQLIGGTYDH